MITIKSLGYAGRLGNQMFQYATLFSISKKTGFDAIIPNQNLIIKPEGTYDVANKKWIAYRFILNECFNLSIPFGDDLSKFDKFYKEPHFHFDENIFKISDNTLIEGYFQSYKYFDDVKNEIKKEFLFKENIFNYSYKKMNSLFDCENRTNEIVAIHVRRGDYVGLPGFIKLDTNYYQNAINKFDDKKYIFFIFSDDIEWCKNVFGEDESIYYSEGETEFVDICMMSLCDHFIIANSTFSWWAAYLGQNANKKVIAPLQWFHPSVGNNISDLFPIGWELI